MPFVPRLFLALSTMTACLVSASPNPEPWRSALYPESWRPGFSDAQGRFLHDFSYAGYHQGEKPIPDIAGPILTVTKAPYLADPTGGQDATQAIQKALDDAGQSGGGVVFLPAGTYRLTLPESGSRSALRISRSRVVLRGAGAALTRLLLETTSLRERQLLALQGEKAPLWTETPSTPGIPLAEDAPSGALQVRLSSSCPYEIGAQVLVRIDATEAFIERLGMTGKWKPETRGARIIAFSRRIRALDAQRKTLTLDAPLRYELRTADGARLEKPDGDVITEVGAEDFSVGMKALTGEGLAELDHQKPGTIGYAASRGCAILVEGVEDGWLRRIQTFRPPGNPEDIHLISCGIRLQQSRRVTVESCVMRFPQYRGGSGDGYLFQLKGQECLLTRCEAEGGRHNFTFGLAVASGNVIAQCTGRKGMLASDFHMWLSPANLIDGHTFDEDYFEAIYRPYGNWGGNPVHGITTTQTVFWNCRGLRYGGPHFTVSANKEQTPPQVIIQSRQFGAGYVIGTRGAASAVETGDAEWVEGVGKGDGLLPMSLFEDQRGRRIKGR